MARYTRKKKRCIPPPKRQKVVAAASSNRPAKRLQWSKAQMDAAIESVLSGTAISINRAAKDHGIPPTTLKDRLSGRVINGTKPGRVSYLGSDEEKELESYLTKANEVGYGKTRREVKAIAEKVAAEKGVLRCSHISDGWWRRFLQRHPNLSLRSGDATGHVRMNAMTKENITNYFDLLKSCIEENGLQNHPECIYNMDESGLPLDPKPPKVIALKGQRKVRYRCSGNKSQITVLGCCSATGHALPPFIIFQGKQLNYQWTHGEIPGTRYGVSDSGWTDRDLFRGWLMDHFLTHAVAGRPLLLLVDGHSSHYDPDTIRFAKEHNVIIFCLPPHTTHEAQPLDISFFGPLKIHWREVCHAFLQSSPGKAVTKYNFVELFSKAWLKTCLPETICSGFRRAGIVPFCPDVLLKRCPGSMEVDEDVCETSTSQHSSTETLDKVNDCSSDNPTFSPEKEELYQRRFEEGYDLFDEDYERWLHNSHPEVLESIVDHFQDIDPITPESPVSSFNITPNDAHPEATPSSLPTISSPLAMDTATSNSSSPAASVPETPPSNSVSRNFSSPVASVPETPPSNIASHSTPTHMRSPLSDLGNRSGNRVSGSSPLGKHLKPVPVQGAKATKTGHARVLTSAECMELLEEKRRKKEQEAEEKEERKRERERKKAERAELLEKKKKERLECQEQRKEAALKKKQAAAAKKQAAAAKKQAGKLATVTRSARGRTKVVPPLTARGCTPTDSTTCSPTAEGNSASGPSSPIPAAQDLTSEAKDPEVWECAFCFGFYQEDGTDWVECGCGRWVHEQCMEEVVLDSNGDERFCPFCLN